MTAERPMLRKSERRRCRAEVAFSDWNGWGNAQCQYIATHERVLAPEGRSLPVCGVHARSKSAYEYRAGDVTSAPVEAIVR